MMEPQGKFLIPTTEGWPRLMPTCPCGSLVFLMELHKASNLQIKEQKEKK